jgi:hypothetical protein
MTTTAFVRHLHLATVHIAAVTRPGRTICGQPVAHMTEVTADDARRLFRECARCGTKTRLAVLAYEEERAPRLEGTPGSLPCFHVTTTRGEVYGVAAQTQQEARQMTQDRLRREGSTDRPGKAERVGSWGAEYGTVLHY